MLKASGLRRAKNTVTRGGGGSGLGHLVQTLVPFSRDVSQVGVLRGPGLLD